MELLIKCVYTNANLDGLATVFGFGKLGEWEHGLIRFKDGKKASSIGLTKQDRTASNYYHYTKLKLPTTFTFQTMNHGGDHRYTSQDGRLASIWR